MVAKVPSKAALALHSWLGTRRIRQNDLPMAKPPDHVSGRTAFTKFALYVVSERAPNLALRTNAADDFVCELRRACAATEIGRPATVDDGF